MLELFKFFEVTKNNEETYLDEIVELEHAVYQGMIAQGKVDQLFTTGRKDISEYIHSPYNSVFIASKQDEGIEKVVAAAYITQKQTPYTYNDITKYFKCGDKYNEYVKSLYESQDKYECALRQAYINKISAFIYARDIILKKYTPNFKDDATETAKNRAFSELLREEYIENGFHEKSVIRELLNKNMSLFYSKICKEIPDYDKFYWCDMEFLKQELQKSSANNVPFFYTKYDSTIELYDKILKLQKHIIHEKSQGIDEEQYFEANTDNTIELDTYLTSNQVRENGLARAVVFEGIKKAIKIQEKYRERDGVSQDEPIFLVSTLHKDNLSSKYVSEFFGLKDNLYVNRRKGRDREVHICKIEGKDVEKYLEKIAKKIAVLYKYNPDGIHISKEEQHSILDEQLEYEIAELNRLAEINEPKYAEYLKFKKCKVESLISIIKKLDEPDVEGRD